MAKEEKKWHTSNGTLNRLFREHNGICQNCGRITHRRKTPPESRATVQHIHPRGDIRRYLQNPCEYTTLFCHTCNARDNKKFNRAMNHYYNQMVGKNSDYPNLLIGYLTQPIS